MQITVVGAGAMGSAIVMDLAGREDVDTVRVLDANARSLQRLSQSVGSEKVKSFQVNARDRDALEPILTGSDCVVGALTYDRSPGLPELALESGSHYCDLGGSDEGVEELLKLDGKAREAGRWVVPSCGLAPGLVNILCLQGVNLFDRAENAHVRVGDIPLNPKPPFDFSVNWSAEKVLDDYTGPVVILEDGKRVTCAPFARLETIGFESPFGALEAFCTSGGLSQLPRELEGKIDHLDLKTIRWPGHAERMGFLLGLGFGEAISIDVRTHLTYRDLLLRRMRQRLTDQGDDVVLLRIVIHGVISGAERTLRWEMIERSSEKLSAMKRCTAIPAAAIAYMLANGDVPGGGAAAPEEAIDGTVFLQQIRHRGIQITETWSDGYVPVTAG